MNTGEAGELDTRESYPITQLFANSRDKISRVTLFEQVFNVRYSVKPPITEYLKW